MITVTAATNWHGMSLSPNQPAAPPSAKSKLTPDERRAQRADLLAAIRLRMAINYELDKRGITTPKALGAMLGMPRDEAVSLLTRQYLREADVALLEALAAQLGVKVPGS